jgi:hypothetical protein
MKSTYRLLAGLTITCLTTFQSQTLFSASLNPENTKPASWMVHPIQTLQDSIDLATSFGDHPRIMLKGGQEKALKASIGKDKTWLSLHQSILKESDRIIDLPVLQRIQIGRRLLDKSREAIRRIFQLSYAYRMTGDRKYLDRAEREMLTIAAFSDWNSSHFLDVAEMTMAMAIGYDWLYGQLPEASRKTIREAIIQKGLEPSLDKRYNYWLTAEHNWNQVCNAGMTFGALAVRDESPELAVHIINRAIKSIRLPMKDYGPDGIYPEGYGYWGYGTSFNVMWLSAMETCFGTDFGLSAMPGFLRSTGFMAHMTGPSGRPFNYSDAGSGGSFHPAMCWMAGKLGDASVLYMDKLHLQRSGVESRVGDRLIPAALLWKGDFRMDKIPAPKDLMWVGLGKNPIAMMRTSWTDPNAIWVAMKGGSGNINHAHMDIGSYVMEAQGVRWAMDFGMQEYESLESKGIKLFGRAQDAQRWTIFRLNNFTHNTIAVDSQLQRVDGYAPIIASGNKTNFMHAVTDLGAVYNAQLAGAKRGIAIAGGNQVVVRDEWTALDKETKVRWTLLTPASVQITGPNEALLSKDGKTLRLRIETDARIQMRTWSTDPPQYYDAPNPGTIMVGFEAVIPAGAKVSVNSFLLPGKVQPVNTPALQDWK